MTIKHCRAATFYSMELPDADALAKHLATVPHTELEATMPYGSGFVNIEPHGELVVEFPGGYAFSLRIDEKNVPGSTLKNELKLWAEKFTELNGYAPGRKALREAREGLIPVLLAKAFVRTKTVTAYYLPAKKMLVVNSISKRVRDTLTAQLVRAVESVKAQTIYISEAKSSLAVRLRAQLDPDREEEKTHFGKFTLGGKVVLVGANGKLSVDVVDLAGHTKGVEEALDSGALVSEIALALPEVGFRLSQDMTVKAISFPDAAYTQYQDTDGDPADNELYWEHEAACQMLIIGNVFDALCELFSYTPPADDGADLI